MTPGPLAMTTNAANIMAAESGASQDDLQAQFLAKLAAARTWKSYVELDHKESYFFTSPNRQRQISSMVAPAQSRMLDAPELNTDEFFIIVQDFITEVVNAFMPESTPWCERGPGMDLKPEIWKRIQADLKEQDAQIFNAMKASNLYAELPKAFYPDLALGTSAMWISRPKLHMPIQVFAVPFRELEIDLGPRGDIDFRCAVRYVRNQYVREMLGQELWDKLGPDMKDQSQNKPSDRTQINWAFWRIWDDDTAPEVWQHVIAVRNTVVDSRVLKGEGSCPLQVMRFGATADWPHGVGPMIQGLPTARQIDEFQMMLMRHASRAIAPPLTYPDDSFVNVAQGIEEDFAYPIRPGTEGAVKPIYQISPPDKANYEQDKNIHRMRRLFYVDYPEQRGDTPPTLGQWMDEAARLQRRIGTPGMSFWHEGPKNIFMRFKYLLEASGVIPPVQVDGRAVATMPRNPTQLAAEQMEVAKAMQALTYFAQTMPEEFKMGVNGIKTLQNIVDKMRLGNMIIMRKPEEFKGIVDQMSKILSPRPVPGPSGQPIGPAA